MRDKGSKPAVSLRVAQCIKSISRRLTTLRLSFLAIGPSCAPATITILLASQSPVLVGSRRTSGSAVAQRYGQVSRAPSA